MTLPSLRRIVSASNGAAVDTTSASASSSRNVFLMILLLEGIPLGGLAVVGTFCKGERTHVRPLGCTDEDTGCGPLQRNLTLPQRRHRNRNSVRCRTDADT